MRVLTTYSKARYWNGALGTGDSSAQRATVETAVLHLNVYQTMYEQDDFQRSGDF